MQSSSPTHVVGLDLIRFLAAAMVMAFHYFTWSWAGAAGTGARLLDGEFAFPGLAQWAWSGWVGVEIFFVISGFVIAFTAEHANALSFVRARILRLAPAAWICATISLAVAVAIHIDPYRALILQYIRSTLFIPIGPYIEGVYWTLGIEVAFYALVALMLRFHSFSRIEWLAAALGLWGSINAFSSLLWPGVAQLSTRASELLLLHHAQFFALGILIWSSWRWGLNTLRVLGIGALAISGCCEIALTAPTFDLLGVSHPSAWAPIAIFLVAVTAIAASVVLNRFLVNTHLAGVLRVLGLATYPLYLMHELVGLVLIRLQIAWGVPPLAAVLVTMAAAILAAIVIAERLEAPLRALLRGAITSIEQRFAQDGRVARPEGGR